MFSVSRLLMVTAATLVLVAPLVSATSERPAKRQRDDDPQEDSILGGNHPVDIFPESYLEGLDPIVRPDVDSFIMSDWVNMAYRPSLEHDVTSEVTPSGIVKLDKIIARDATRVLFSIEGNIKTFIMYVHDCGQGDEGLHRVHPLISQAAYARAAGAVVDDATIIFISPPTPLAESSKTSFSMTREAYDRCISIGGSVRYALLIPNRPRTPIPVQTFARFMLGLPDIRMGYTKIFQFGASLMRTIKQLHERQVVHGDLRVESIILHRVPDDSLKVRLYDFTNSGWVNPLTGMMNHARQLPRKSPQDIIWKSLAELMGGQGHIYTAMDEVNRAFEIVAFLVNNATSDPRIELLNADMLEAYKGLGQLFDHQVVDKLGHLNPVVPTLLGRLQESASKLTHPPPYEEISMLFGQIATALQAAVMPPE
jgi:hypothetical protein